MLSSMQNVHVKTTKHSLLFSASVVLLWVHPLYTLVYPCAQNELYMSPEHPPHYLVLFSFRIGFRKKETKHM